MRSDTLIKVIRAQTSCSSLTFADCCFPLFTLKFYNSTLYSLYYILLKVLMVSYSCYVCAFWISSYLPLLQPFRLAESLTRFAEGLPGLKVQISFILEDAHLRESPQVDSRSTLNTQKCFRLISIKEKKKRKRKEKLFNKRK